MWSTKLLIERMPSQFNFVQFKQNDPKRHSIERWVGRIGIWWKKYCCIFNCHNYNVIRDGCENYMTVALQTQKAATTANRPTLSLYLSISRQRQTTKLFNKLWWCLHQHCVRSEHSCVENDAQLLSDNVLECASEAKSPSKWTTVNGIFGKRLQMKQILR